MSEPTFVEQVIDLLEELELDIHWNNRVPHLMCNDAFWWATADCEAFSADDFEAIRQAHKDSEYHGDLLWICRKRQMRPQGAMYAYLPEKEWPLFDACGPARASDLGNPVGTDGIAAYIAKKKAEQEARKAA